MSAPARSAGPRPTGHADHREPNASGSRAPALTLPAEVVAIAGPRQVRIGSRSRSSGTIPADRLARSDDADRKRKTKKSGRRPPRPRGTGPEPDERAQRRERERDQRREHQQHQHPGHAVLEVQPGGEADREVDQRRDQSTTVAPERFPSSVAARWIGVSTSRSRSPSRRHGDRAGGIDGREQRALDEQEHDREFPIGIRRKPQNFVAASSPPTLIPIRIAPTGAGGRPSQAGAASAGPTPRRLEGLLPDSAGPRPRQASKAWSFPRSWPGDVGGEAEL